MRERKPDPGQEGFIQEERARLITLTAPAGTGKTAALAMRFAAKVEKGTDPGRILMVTFTNQARDTFAERLEDEMKRWGVRDVRPEDRETLEWNDPAPLWIGTFHDTCQRLLQAHLKAVWRVHPVRILDREGTQAMMDGALIEEGGGEDPAEHRREVRRLRRAVSDWKRAGVDPREHDWERARLHDHPGGLTKLDRQERETAGTYQEALDRANVWDMDDLPLVALRLMRGDPRIGEAWGRRFDEVMVDEVQDCEPIQLEVLRYLARHSVICIAGDDVQQIYGWRQAVGTKGFKPWTTTHGEPAHHKLRHDYRIPQRSTAAVDQLREAAGGSIEKLKHCATEEGETPIHWIAHGKEGETDCIAERAKRCAEKGRQVAIACRTNARANALARGLRERGLEVSVETRSEGAELLNAVGTWLEGAARSEDAAIEGMLRGPGWDLAWGLLARAKRRALAGGGGLAAALRGLAAEDERYAKAGEALERLGKAEEIGNVREWCDRVIEISELGRHAQERSSEEQAGYREGVERARAEAAAGTGREKIGSRLRRSAEAGEIEGGEIRIGTLHALKGREIDHVIAVGWVEGEIPREEDEVKEERCLAYVALTRARRGFESVGAGTGPYGAPRAVSRFVHEAGIETREWRAQDG